MNDNITCGEALIRLLAEYGADLEVEEVLGGERLVGEATGGGGVPPGVPQGSRGEGPRG